MSSRAVRFGLLVGVSIIMIALTGLFLILHTEDFDSRIQFELIDHNGAAVSEETYQGQHLLVFFGFTNCPNICPTQMAKLTHLIDRLDPRLGTISLLPVFVSIDPERDTVQRVREYIAHFHPRFVGLTGSPDALEQARRHFDVIAAPSSSADDSSPRHTTVAYLVGPSSRLITHIAADADIEDATQRLREVLL